MEAYKFGSTKFKDFIWLKAGALFKDPGRMEIEMKNRGSFIVEVCKPDGIVVGKGQRSNVSGWQTFDFRNGGEFGPGIPNGNYKIKLVNSSPGLREVVSGQLWYD